MVGLVQLSLLPYKLYAFRRCEKLHSGQSKVLCDYTDCPCYHFCKYSDNDVNVKLRELYDKDKASERM